MKTFNKSHFNNGLTRKILKAIRLSLKYKKTIIIKNRKGIEILKVKYNKLLNIFHLVDLNNTPVKVQIMKKYCNNAFMLKFLSTKISFCQL